MANLATSLVAQALQNKPGGMIIGGNHFGGSAGPNPSMGPRGGYNRDYDRVRILNNFRDYIYFSILILTLTHLDLDIYS